jgi:hypothetical protein
MDEFLSFFDFLKYFSYNISSKMDLNRVDAAENGFIFHQIPSPIKNTCHFSDLRATFGKYDPLSAFTSHILKIRFTFPVYRPTCRKIFGSGGEVQ